ncbi:MAG: phosphotransferase family protein [Angustibacter sp.]
MSGRPASSTGEPVVTPSIRSTPGGAASGRSNSAASLGHGTAPAEASVHAKRLLHDAAAVDGDPTGMTFCGTWLRERAVVRLYLNDPGQIRIDLAVRRLLNGVVPLPKMLAAEPWASSGTPPYLITAVVPGALASELMDRGLHESAAAALGRQCARIITRLRGITLPDHGSFADADLAAESWPAHRHTLIDWYEHHERELATHGLDRHGAPDLHAGVLIASNRLASADRSAPTLVHGALDGSNLIVDPNIGRLRAVLDWGECFAGDWAHDVGSLLRGVERGTAAGGAAASSWATFRAGMVDSLHASLYEDGTSTAADGRDDDWLSRARDLDLFALIRAAAEGDVGAAASGRGSDARQALRRFGATAAR